MKYVLFMTARLLYACHNGIFSLLPQLDTIVVFKLARNWRGRTFLTTGFASAEVEESRVNVEATALSAHCGIGILGDQGEP